MLINFTTIPLKIIRIKFFFETTKKINEKLIKYNKNELVPLKSSLKEKINIGFVSKLIYETTIRLLIFLNQY